MKKIIELEKQYFRNDLPNINIGDEIIVNHSLSSNDHKKEKIIRFEGMVIAKKNPNRIDFSFVVIKEVNKLVIKNKYFFHSPSLISIEIKKLQKTKKYRRAKLYYLEREKIKKNKF